MRRGLVAGPLGAIVGSNAREKRTTDTRVAWVIVNGPSFQRICKSMTGSIKDAHAFAANVTTAGRVAGR